MGLAHYATLAVVLAAGPAHAEMTVDKLGEGYELLSDGGSKLDVRKGKRRATLVVNAYLQAEGEDEKPLKIDAKKRTVSLSWARECDPARWETWSYDQLEARLVNTEGLALHLKKQYAKAAPLFEKAVKLDPTWRLPAYNLASAQTKLGKKAEALATLAPWLKSEPLSTYAVVAVDPELAPLLVEKELTSLKSATPGKVTMKGGAIEGYIAYAPDRKLLAISMPESGYLTCLGGSAIALVDVTSGKRVAQIPTTDCVRRSTKAQADFRAKRAAIVMQILNDFGFAPTESETAGTTRNDKDKQVARLPKSKLGAVENANGGVNILRDGKPVAQTAGAIHERFNDFTYVPAAKVAIISSYWPSDLCAQHREDVVPVP